MQAPESKSVCPACGEAIQRRNRGDARPGPRAKLMYGVAAVVGLAWAVAVFLWSPVFLVPTGLYGIVLCGAFYTFPGILIAMYASRLPRVRTLSCSACGWSEVRTLAY